MASPSPNWKRILMVNAMVTAFAFALNGGVAAPTWGEAFRRLLIAAIYVNAVGTPAGLIMPRVLARFDDRNRVVQLTIQMLSVLAILAAGIVTVPALLVVLGLIGPEHYVENAVPLNWPAYALPATIVLTIGISLYEGMRRDLETKLRTKERDEAVARQLAAESQLAFLESRVQPHFLFNALNSIAALIPEDPVRAERMVGQVASLLRSSLDAKTARLVPLEEELRVVRDYLEVERVRVGDRLRYEVCVTNGAARIGIPPLSVQTLVENAVKYAVSSRRSGGSVTVQVSTDNGIARIEVRDDGPGFGESDVRAGHGLALLRSRLALLFGNRAALRIDSKPGSTSVVMDIDDSRLPR
jgi:signal transduction histidine kinase